ncbi:PH domain-containing protein [Listeria costaricensis]|uniref:PH domain-containing protein n=1 Tax=Listeria costaricensis TaxID=2026604 RepID=UPI000C07A319|nr:PH domain-containing protein [Listeria costaricensis]
MELNHLEKKLPARIKIVWQISYAISALIFLLLSAGLLILLYLTEVSLWWSLIGFGFTAGYAVIVFGFVIPFRYKRWSYQIRHDEIEIQHGIIFRSRTLIPMIRIQHVETTQGPLLRKEKLMALQITTAAGSHTIEAVDAEEADTLRYHILELVKVAKEDV